MSLELNFEQATLLPLNTQCFQLESGQIVFYERLLPQKLYLNDGNRVEVAASLPKGNVEHIIAHENSIFFNTTNGKIYQAIVTASNEIIVQFIREMHDFEIMCAAAVCTRNFAGKVYLFPMYEEPKLVDRNRVMPLDVATAGELKGVHRGMQIYLQRGSNEQNLVVTKLSENAIGIKLPLHAFEVRFFSRDSSKFLFFSQDQDLYMVDTEKMEVLPRLYLKDCFSTAVIGFISGALILTGQKDCQDYLITGQLPDEHAAVFQQENPGPVHKWKPTAIKTNNSVPSYGMENWRASKREEWLKSTEGLRSGSTEKRKGYFESGEFDRDHAVAMKKKKWQDEMTANINELLDKNDVLNGEVEKLQKIIHKKEIHAQQPAVELANTNTEQEQMSALLEAENKEVSKNLERTMTLNDELDAANDQLIEERDELIRHGKERKEAMDKQIEELLAKTSALTVKRDQMRKLKEKMELKRELEEMLKENEELANSLVGRSKESAVSKLLADNETIKQDFHVKIA